jgi:hypothetical protein
VGRLRVLSVANIFEVFLHMQNRALKDRNLFKIAMGWSWKSTR